jgi:hypothetical protein
VRLTGLANRPPVTISATAAAAAAAAAASTVDARVESLRPHCGCSRHNTQGRQLGAGVVSVGTLPSLPFRVRAGLLWFLRRDRSPGSDHGYRCVRRGREMTVMRAHGQPFDGESL